MKPGEKDWKVKIEDKAAEIFPYMGNGKVIGHPALATKVG